MKWKDAFGSAMEELKAIRALLAPVARLDDPTVGLTALHGELTQTRLKTLEVVQGASPDCGRRTARYAAARTG
ncbi:hypothetical protein ACIQRK_36405 [Streptomyces anulatus]